MKRTLLIGISLAAGLGITLAQAPKKETKKEEGPKGGTNEVAVMKTTEGDLVIALWPDVAPKTVENFTSLARSGFYDGTAFHRIMRGFMIQGGDPLTKDATQEAAYGKGGPGYTIKDEFSSRRHVRGVISMANTGAPDSAGSQFFICHAAAPSLDGKYAAFGKVIKGEDVLDKIANTPVVRSRSGEPSKPSKRVGIESITIVPADSVK